MSSPLLPTAYDLLWSLALLCYLGLVVAALVSVGRSGRRLGPATTLGWSLAILLVPLLGAGAWFIAGRRALAVAATD